MNQAAIEAEARRMEAARVAIVDHKRGALDHANGQSMRETLPAYVQGYLSHERYQSLLVALAAAERA